MSSKEEQDKAPAAFGTSTLQRKKSEQYTNMLTEVNRNNASLRKNASIYNAFGLTKKRSSSLNDEDASDVVQGSPIKPVTSAPIFTSQTNTGNLKRASIIQRETLKQNVDTSSEGSDSETESVVSELVKTEIHNDGEDQSSDSSEDSDDLAEFEISTPNHKFEPGSVVRPSSPDVDAELDLTSSSASSFSPSPLTSVFSSSSSSITTTSTTIEEQNIELFSKLRRGPTPKSEKAVRRKPAPQRSKNKSIDAVLQRKFNSTKKQQRPARTRSTMLLVDPQVLLHFTVKLRKPENKELAAHLILYRKQYNPTNKNNFQWQECGHTEYETFKNASITFEKKVQLKFYFEKTEEMLLSLVNDTQVHLAACEFSTGQVIGRQGLQLNKVMLTAASGGDAFADVQITAEKAPNPYLGQMASAQSSTQDTFLDLEIQVQKYNVKKYPYPFIEISQQADDDEQWFISLYTSEILSPQPKKSLHFRKIQIQLQSSILQNKRKLRFELFYWDSMKNFKSLIGYFMATYEELLKLSKQHVPLFIDQREKQETKGYQITTQKSKTSLYFDMVKPRVEEAEDHPFDHSFLDYMKAGLRFNLVYAIDFTIDNKMRNPVNLHDKAAEPNIYEKLMSSIGKRVQQYSDNGDVHIIGYGGVAPSAKSNSSVPAMTSVKSPATPTNSFTIEREYFGEAPVYQKVSDSSFNLSTIRRNNIGGAVNMLLNLTGATQAQQHSLTMSALYNNREVLRKFAAPVPDISTALDAYREAAHDKCVKLNSMAYVDVPRNYRFTTVTKDLLPTSATEKSEPASPVVVEEEKFAPNDFYPVIADTVEFIQSTLASNTSKTLDYYIMVIMVPNDYIHVKETIFRLIDASHKAPLSIVIIGVGSGAFKTLRSINFDYKSNEARYGKPMYRLKKEYPIEEELIDGHSVAAALMKKMKKADIAAKTSNLEYRGYKCYRDVAQFVRANDFYENTDAIAEYVLRHIPKQVVKFWRAKGVKPPGSSAAPSSPAKK